MKTATPVEIENKSKTAETVPMLSKLVKMTNPKIRIKACNK